LLLAVSVYFNPVRERKSDGDPEKQHRMRPDKSEVSLLLADNQKAKTLTGWEPQFTFEAALEETIQYLRLKYKPLQYSV
jgi:nucleoside-diphosphate-sugar epimerase